MIAAAGYLRVIKRKTAVTNWQSLKLKAQGNLEL